MINTHALEIWLILQVILEAFLVFLVVMFLIKLRRMGSGKQVDLPPDLESSMERFLNESRKLSESFDQSLEEKRKISMELVLRLEHKIGEMRELLRLADASASQAAPKRPQLTEPGRANPAAPESRTLVLRLANKGMSIEDIARQAQLARGEVELILDLEKQAGRA